MPEISERISRSSPLWASASEDLMRLCVITGPSPRTWGALSIPLAAALTRRGHTVWLSLTEEDAADSLLYPYPVTRLTRRTSIPRRLLAFTYAILRQGQSADVLFVSDYGFPAAAANLWLRKPLVMKVVSDFAWEFASRHGWADLSVTEFQSARSHWRVRMLKTLRNWYVRRADRIIVPSQHVGRLVQSWGVRPEKLSVVYNALPTESKTSVSQEEARRCLGWPLDTPTVVTVGRLAEVKRIDLQLHALVHLEGVQLMIVGDGPEAEALRSLCRELKLEDRVVFTGTLAHDQALLAIRAADIFVLSSRTEGLSRPARSDAAGTPCVATAVGGNSGSYYA
jgi:glycosyltransferase involved in cell wall biosynthesis